MTIHPPTSPDQTLPHPLSEGWEAWSVSRLESELKAHNHRYWDQDAPTISDYDYDRLVERLRTLASDSPVLDELGPSTADTVGESVTHAAPMLSLEKCYDEANLLKWTVKFEGPIIMSPKIDGVACSLRYSSQGELYLAATRGDGAQGESITPNVEPMQSIPQRIPPQGVEVEVRGEIYMPLSAFNQLTDRFSNPRNAAAGTLKRKTERNAADLGLRFFAYDLFGIDRPTASERLDLAREWGFEPVPYQVLSRHELQAGYEGYVQRRDTLDYEIDGVVYRAERSAEYTRLGSTAHHPRGAIAYKLQGESAKTTLHDIEWGVSRNGILTPVGIVQPVKLSGAMVSRITLHHWGMIKSKGLTLGAEVIAMRRGGVIPHLETVVTPGPQPLEAPLICPQCPHLSAPTMIEGDILRCGFHGTCEPQAAAILRHWVNVTKIEGFGSVWLDTLTRSNILTTPVDLYTLTAADVLPLDGVGEGRAKAWLESISESRLLPLSTFLCALGVQDLGKSASHALARRFLDLASIRLADVESIADIDNFGELTAQHIIGGLKSRESLIDELLAHITVLDEAPAAPPAADAPLAKQSFVFTGTLVSMKRSDAQSRVKALGAQTPTGVSAKLSYLVIGDVGKAGSKKTKAEKHGVTILTESAFIELLAEAENTEVGSTEIGTSEIGTSEADPSVDLLPPKSEQNTQPPQSSTNERPANGNQQQLSLFDEE